MVDQASSLLLTRLIAPGYQAGFLLTPAATAQAVLDPLGFDLIDIIVGVDFKGLPGATKVPYGLIAQDRTTKQVYIAIRGTDSLEEWAEDGWAVPEPWPFCNAPGLHTHKGFTDVYGTLQTSGGQSLLDAVSMADQVVITGHSLGAALATLAAADFGPRCSLCVTFEGPRVGDLAFVNWMDARVPAFYRYVIIGDVVPHLPPEKLGYFHAGTAIELDPAGVIPLSLDPQVYLSSHHVLTSVQQLLTSD